MNKISVLLADDHPLLRKGFAAVLTDSNIQVVGEANTPEKAIEMYKDLKPDVLVIDIQFEKEATGLDAIKEILKFDQNSIIVVLSQYDKTQLIRECYVQGAKAYVPKNRDEDILVEAIRKVATGEKYFIPDIAEKLAIFTTEEHKNPHPKTILTEREFKIYKLIAMEKKPVQISKELEVAERTVTSDLANIKEKLELESNIQLIKHAIKHGVINIEDEDITL